MYHTSPKLMGARNYNPVEHQITHDIGMMREGVLERR